MSSELAPSPFLSKLNSFSELSESEISHLHNFIADRTADLSTVDQELADLDTVWERLRAKRAAIENEITIHQSLVAPIRQVPDLILQEIFLACIPVEHNALIHPDHAPLLFGRVCHRWRQLSHETPLLWKRFHISGLYDFTHTNAGLWGQPERNFSLPSTEFQKAFNNALSLWLSRVSGCPLAISYIQRNNALELTQPNSYLDSFNQVLAVQDQIESLELVAGVFEYNLMIPLGPMLGLKKFLIQGSTSKPWQDFAILTSPNLQHVSLSGNIYPLEIVKSWSNLQHLQLYCIPSLPEESSNSGLDQNGVHEILLQCPNLVSVDLTITLWRHRNFSLPVDLLYLEHLVLNSGYHNTEAHVTPDIPGLLHLLNMPKLRKFHFGTHSQAGILQPSLIAASNPDWLSIYAMQESEHWQSWSLADILAALPQSLPTSLHFSFPQARWITYPGWIPSIKDVVYEKLAQEQSILPLMHHLQVMVPLTQTDYSALMALIRARCPVLQSLQLEVQGTEKLNIEEELQEMEKAGLTLKIVRYDEGAYTEPTPRPWSYSPSIGLDQWP
uniref:F-box domain-containing protein n=1 Tax=Mycena chlorophos TaxID=658473 RepID=A0ABQ0LLH9_MYCCL|nr:predicted protein [Mycena chlorophos]